MYNPYDWSIRSDFKRSELEREANKFGKLAAQKALLELDIQTLEEMIEAKTDELYDIEQQIEESRDAYRKLYI